jgi:hypothetical protein
MRTSVKQGSLLLGVTLLLAGLNQGCSTTARRSDLANWEVREAVLWYLIEAYDALEPQHDDPIGREYCLGFEFRLGEEGTAAPAEFLQRFAGRKNVHSLAWCEEHQGRLLSVGPLTLGPGPTAQAWSFSWVESRRGGTDCLHSLRQVDNWWFVEPGCMEGGIYD